MCIRDRYNYLVRYLKQPLNRSRSLTSFRLLCRYVRSGIFPIVLFPRCQTASSGNCRIFANCEWAQGHGKLRKGGISKKPRFNRMSIFRICEGNILGTYSSKHSDILLLVDVSWFQASLNLQVFCFAPALRVLHGDCFLTCSKFP